MTEIRFQGAIYPQKQGSSVLETLLEQGIAVPFSCQSGVCQTCLMRLENVAALPAKAQENLKDTLRAQGYFLACQCYPDVDLNIVLPEDMSLFGRASVMEKKLLSAQVCSLKLLSATPMYYRAGQFINLRNPEGLIRSYSLASLPMQQEYLELHVRRHQGGRMSNWLFDELQEGEHLDFQGPNGNCFYISGNPEQEILLIGTGTGLAPLLGIARDALYSGHTGKISLYHGTTRAADLYGVQDLACLAMQHENFHYFGCVSDEDSRTEEKLLNGRADDLAFERHTDLSKTCLFLCGAPAMVKSAQQRAYLAGAAMSAIHADPFLTCDSHPQ